MQEASKELHAEALILLCLAEMVLLSNAQHLRPRGGFVNCLLEKQTALVLQENPFSELLARIKI